MPKKRTNKETLELIIKVDDAYKKEHGESILTAKARDMILEVLEDGKDNALFVNASLNAHLKPSPEIKIVK